MRVLAILILWMVKFSIPFQSQPAFLLLQIVNFPISFPFNLNQYVNMCMEKEFYKISLFIYFWVNLFVNIILKLYQYYIKIVEIVILRFLKFA